MGSRRTERPHTRPLRMSRLLVCAVMVGGVFLAHGLQCLSTDHTATHTNVATVVGLLGVEALGDVHMTTPTGSGSLSMTGTVTVGGSHDQAHRNGKLTQEGAPSPAAPAGLPGHGVCLALLSAAVGLLLALTGCRRRPGQRSDSDPSSQIQLPSRWRSREEHRLPSRNLAVLCVSRT